MIRVFNFIVEDLQNAEYYINATDMEYELMSISITPITNEEGEIEYSIILVGKEKVREYSSTSAPNE